MRLLKCGFVLKYVIGSKSLLLKVAGAENLWC